MGEAYVSRKVEVPDIQHHAYHTLGVDKSVLVKQAVARRDDYRHPETTIIHNHPHTSMGNKVLGCNEGCTIYQPGYEVRSIAAYPVPLDGGENRG